MSSPDGTHGLTDPDKAQLVGVARRSIEHGLREQVPAPVDPTDYPPPLRERRASFVTLRKNRELRGCIGTLEARQTVVGDVAENAFKSAFRDPRFPPVDRFEVELLEVSIAVLSPLERLRVASEEELIAKIRPRIDGLLIREGSRQGTFLPAVWEGLPEARTFVRELKRKAGLSADFWSASLEISRYTVDSIS